MHNTNNGCSKVAYFLHNDWISSLCAMLTRDLIHIRKECFNELDGGGGVVHAPRGHGGIFPQSWCSPVHFVETKLKAPDADFTRVVLHFKNVCPTPPHFILSFHLPPPPTLSTIAIDINVYRHYWNKLRPSSCKCSKLSKFMLGFSHLSSECQYRYLMVFVMHANT